MGPAVLARLMDTQIWCLPASSVGEGSAKEVSSASTFVLEKVVSPVLFLMPDNSVPPQMSPRAFGVAAPVLELRGRESE